MSTKEKSPQFEVKDLNFQQILDGMQAHVWIKDLRGIYIYTNKGCKRCLGVKPEDVIGKDDYAIVSHDIAEQFLASDRETLKRGKEVFFPRVAKEINGVSKVWSEVVKVPLRDADDQIIGLMGISYDTLAYDEVIDHDELYHLAYYDLLTELSNRVKFKLELEKMCEESVISGREIVVMSIDLDFFQRINESYGHRFGDHLLKKLASYLRGFAPDNALVARIDGDEFAIAFYACNRHENCALHWLGKLQTLFNSPFFIDGRELRLSVSFGVTTFPKDADNVDNLLLNIDAAKNEAKQRGRNRYEFYRQGSQKIAARKIEIQTQLHKALNNDNFFGCSSFKTTTHIGQSSPIK